MRLVSNPLGRVGSFTILVVSLIHIYLSLLILFEPMTANATNVRALVMGFQAIHSPDHLTFISCVIILSALCAVAGIILRLGYIRVLTLLPQGIFLGFSATGGQLAAWLDHYLDGTGHYPNGMAIPWQHISADQIGYAALFLIYAAAILRRCWEPNG